jgi:hypothetical protein
MKLSISFAGIRHQKWLTLYQSISNITTLPKDDYEMVIVGPYDLPPELQNEPNVRLIKDWGNPTRCYQLGILHSKGEYILTGIADDGVFSPTLAVDKALDVLDSRKKIVTLTYTESRSLGKIKHNKMSWQTGGHPFMKEKAIISDHYLLVMAFVMRRDYLMEIGGLDCNFEYGGLALPDLSVRLQDDGAEVVMGERIMDLVLEVGGNHKPIEDAFVEHDMPYFNKIYSQKTRSKVDFDNWKQAPAVWTRRFKG